MNEITSFLAVEHLVASSSLELMVIDNDLIIHHCTQVIRAIFDLPTSNSISENCNDASGYLNEIICARIGVSIADKILQTIASGQVFTGEFQDRNNVWYLLRIFPCKEKYQGKKIALVSAVNIDYLKIAEKNLQKKAHFDSLTGLPNRASFMEMLPRAVARARQSKMKMAVFFIDIDNFKQINDNLGHDVGDCLLKEAAQLMLSVMPETDFIARLGGDEFGVIVESANSINKFIEIAGQFIHKFSQTIKINTLEVKTSLSIGIASYPNGGKTAQELLQHADIAMYRAKELGKDSYQFFNSLINEQVQRKHLIESHLKNAVQNNELGIVFQPQIDTEHGQKIVGLEALARWQSSILGEVRPEEFISIAEESKLIFSISEWLIENACKQYQQLLLKRDFPKLQLSVNVSAKQITKPGFSEFIKRILTQYTIPAELITVEITESALLEQTKKAVKMITDLSQYGIKFSLDDFGVGYSSLRYLKDLPISALKIDQSFVFDIASDHSNKHIIKAIVALAKGLELKVVAEGVETQEQLAYIQKYGCHIIQGYIFSQPLKAKDLEAFIVSSEKLWA